MRSIDRLAHKYALNIKQIRGPGSTKIADFKNLNRGFYDEIEKTDLDIKDKQKSLEKCKKQSLTEFVYTNKDIPDGWKKKVNYEDDLMKLLVNDTKLLSYIGTVGTSVTNLTPHGNLPPLNSITLKKSFNDISNQQIQNMDNKYLKTKSCDRLPGKKNFSTTNLEKEKEKTSLLSDNNTNVNLLSTSLGKENPHNKFRTLGMTQKNNFPLGDKEVSNILDDFKTAYPIKEKLKELYISTNYYNNESSKNWGSKRTFTEFTKNPFKISHHYDLKVDKRPNVFRQNVFNNLVVSSSGYNDLSKIESGYKSKPIVYDHKSFLKKLNVSNPLIKKNLEGIKYYGPYFSHCPPCYNKNMEYYSNLEPNQCLEIIHHIKKLRMKNTILDIKKTAKTTRDGNINDQEDNEEKNIPKEIEGKILEGDVLMKGSMTNRTSKENGGGNIVNEVIKEEEKSEG